MRHLAGLLALVLALSACAAAPRGPVTLGVADIGGGGHITLFDDPCAGKVAAFVAEHAQPQFRTGWRRLEGVFRMRESGKLERFAGCWMEPPLEISGGERLVYTLFEDGDQYILPRAAFESVPGVGI